MSTRPESQPADVILQIDQVGSFRLILGTEVTIGGPGETGQSGHIATYSRLSTRHARMTRGKQGYAIEPLQGSVMASRQESAGGDKNQLLMLPTYMTNNNWVRLDSGFAIQLKQTSPLSQTALLEMDPENRLADRVDKVVLMETMLLLGPSQQMHLPCPHWNRSAVLIYRNKQFFLRTPLGLEPSSPEPPKEFKVPFNKHIEHEEIGIYLEPFG